MLNRIWRLSKKNKNNVIKLICAQCCIFAFVANCEQFSWQGNVPTQMTNVMQSVFLNDNENQNLQISHDLNWLYFDIKKAKTQNAYIKLLTVKM